MTKPPFYITTAISYPNGAPHIGHAYEALATDALARFKRHDGHEVFFLTGTDEHGQKMQQTAEKMGISTEQLVEDNVSQFQEMVAALNCSNNDFIRTTQERHKKAAQAIWQKMVDNGDIYTDKYAGWYSVRDEAFYTDAEVATNEDGTKVAEATGTPVEWVEEDSYFFKLSSYEEKLLKLYEDDPHFIGPDSRRNEVVNFVKGGLNDLSVSRTSFDWGITVPGTGEDDKQKHVMYVWVDALTNYLTAIGYPDEDSEIFQKFWPADVHIIGKDILRFHAVYWPAFLMSAGLALPKRIFGHGFLMYNGSKISKSDKDSTKAVPTPFEMIEQYGVDPLRFFFLREVSFGRDGNYSHESMVSRMNADLANDLGNLAQRSLSMINKNCGGVVPEYGEFTAEDQAILAMAEAVLEPARQAMEEQAIHRAVDETWKVITEANRYFTAQEPWALKKTDPARQATILYVTAEVIRQVSILAQPYIPGSAAKLLDLLEIAEDARNFDALGEIGRLASGVALPKPEGVFPRYVEAG